MFGRPQRYEEHQAKEIQPTKKRRRAQGSPEANLRREIKRKGEAEDEKSLQLKKVKPRKTARTTTRAHWGIEEFDTRKVIARDTK